MRILLTGVTGQVGSALRAPLSAFATLLPADRGQLDLSQPATLSSALDRLKPDLIVNPAAYTAVDLAEDECELAFRVNSDAPAAMAQSALTAMIKKSFLVPYRYSAFQPALTTGVST